MLEKFEAMLVSAKTEERAKFTAWSVGALGWTQYHNSVLLVRGLERSIAHERHKQAGLPLDGLRYYRWRLDEARFQLSLQEDWSPCRRSFEDEVARSEAKVSEVLAARVELGLGDDLDHRESQEQRP